MIHLFLDTNILIDFLVNRQPFSLEAAKLFDYSEKGKAKIYVAAVSYNNLYYIIRQSLSHSDTIKLLDELSEMVEIIDTTKSVVTKAIKSDFKDFEDAIQYHCALSNNKIKAIVTRDSKGLKKSSLSVLSPKEALGLFES